jgi:hypothetical protein
MSNPVERKLSSGPLGLSWEPVAALLEIEEQTLKWLQGLPRCQEHFLGLHTWLREGARTRIDAVLQVEGPWVMFFETFDGKSALKK